MIIHQIYVANGTVWFATIKTMVVRDSRSSRIKEVVIERHTKNHETKKTALIALYVDDTTIAAGSIGEMKKKKLNEHLMDVFKIKDMEPVNYWLGIELK